MIPYADFTYFGLLLLYAVIPTFLLGIFGNANRRWALLITAVGLIVQYQTLTEFGPGGRFREIWLVAGFGLWQWILIRGYAATRGRGGAIFYATVALSLLPLLLVKTVPLFSSHLQIGFLGISYISFRALDLVFSLRDQVITAPKAGEFVAFLFFFPTISAGPIDRYRRFHDDWKRTRTRAEFVVDLDGAVHRVFRGFFYKFILAALIKRYGVDRFVAEPGFLSLLGYMYSYSFYLFFDFAGYSAFAIALSYLLGIHTPENFDRPFQARNIRDFWNRWHITLSFWFRDHVYMRFALAATRGHWFANRHAAAITGYFLSFGLMGLWHGIEWHFILYGLYQAALLSVFHLFAEWSKGRNFPSEKWWWRFASILVTFHAVCFGFLIFSGRLGSGH